MLRLGALAAGLGGGYFFRRRSTGCRELLEGLESRVLLSAAPSGLLPLASTLPNEAAISAPKFSDLWHLQNTGQTLSNPSSGPATGTPGADIKATGAWDYSTGSKSVVIAVLDTGVDLSQPDLISNIWNNPNESASNGVDNDHNGYVNDIHGWNFVDNNNNVQDTSLTGHGTLVSGVIGAQGNNGIGVSGVAWNVSLMELKVGTDSGVDPAAVTRAINYVILMKQRGVNIVAINASYISFGSPSLSQFQAISSAGSNGILYIAAAGNSSMNLDTLVPSGFLPSNMIWVAATDNHDQLWSQSNYGKNSVALGAPGVDILSTWKMGLYLTVSGTSFAAPMVSGAVALLASYAPTATMAQLRSAILSNVDPLASLAGTTSTGGRLNVLKAIRSLAPVAPVNHSPLGNFEYADSSFALGWTYDPDSPTTALNVQAYVDGQPGPTAVASNTRPDLVPVAGSANHGYTIDLSGLTPTLHRVDIYAFDAQTNQRTLLGSKTVNSNAAPFGYIDILDGYQVVGWAFDREAGSGPVRVRVDIDNQQPFMTLASNNRPDLQSYLGSTNHGYSFIMPRLTTGTHTITVWAADSSDSGLVMLGQKQLTYVDTASVHMPYGNLEVLNSSVVAGWAYDADAGAAPINVRVDIDGTAGVPFSANYFRQDLQNYLGSGAHGWAMSLASLSAGAHRVDVYMIDAGTGTPVLLASRMLNNAAPYGNVEGLTSQYVVGWAFSPGLGSAAATIRVDIDGMFGALTSASTARADLTPVVGSPNHGFLAMLPQMSPGTHRVTVYVLDPFSLAPKVLADQSVNVA